MMIFLLPWITGYDLYWLNLYRLLKVLYDASVHYIQSLLHLVYVNLTLKMIETVNEICFEKLHNSLQCLSEFLELFFNLHLKKIHFTQPLMYWVDNWFLRQNCFDLCLWFSGNEDSVRKRCFMDHMLLVLKLPVVISHIINAEWYIWLFHFDRTCREVLGEGFIFDMTLTFSESRTVINKMSKEWMYCLNEISTCSFLVWTEWIMA